MRRSSAFFSLLFGCAFALAVLMGHARAERSARRPVLERNAALVRGTGLTDLALFTEARYTRHLSQADLHSAFQDHPFSLDHFPTGSLHAPPRLLRRSHAR